jgi:chromosome segregation ATPase
MPKKTQSPPSDPPWQVILEDIRSQNRATLEAVTSFERRYERDRAEDRAHVNARFDVVEGVLREHSKDIRELKTDVAELKTDVAELKTDVAVLKSDVAVLKTEVAEIKTDLRRVDGKVDQLSTLEPRVGALERSGH